MPYQGLRPGVLRELSRERRGKANHRELSVAREHQLGGRGASNVVYRLGQELFTYYSLNW